MAPEERTEGAAAALRDLIRSIPDFPRPGIVFRDVTPFLADPIALRSAVELLAARLKDSGPVDLVVGAEARGFILGPALAIRLGTGFVPARREGKLPARTEGIDYEVEYGPAELYMHGRAVPCEGPAARPEGGARTWSVKGADPELLPSPGSNTSTNMVWPASCMEMLAR